MKQNKQWKWETLTIKGLIFDFDGLILDTEGLVFQSWHELYQENGLDLSMVETKIQSFESYRTKQSK